MTEMIGEQMSQKRNKPLPRINAGDENLPRVSQKAWDALQAANNPPKIFRYGSALARIDSVENRPAITILNQDKLDYVLAYVAYWYRCTLEKVQASYPPLRVVRHMLVCPDIPLPSLSRIVEAPVFAPDGTLQTTPGYHPASRCYYVPSKGLVIPEVPQQPSSTDTSRAVTLITKELLETSPLWEMRKGRMRWHFCCCRSCVS